MNILKKALGLSLMGVVLVTSLPATARIAANSLALNRIAANTLATNRIAANRIAANSLAASAGNGAFTDIAVIVLSDGSRVTG